MTLLIWVIVAFTFSAVTSPCLGSWIKSAGADALDDSHRESACPSPTTVRASYYGPGFNGQRTASGRIFRQADLTAAHRSWRFGTKVRVTNLRNGRDVVVTITDRGPYVRGRSLDLSVGAAQAIGATGSGVVSVRLDPLCGTPADS